MKIIKISVLGVFMDFGFLKVGAYTPKIKILDVEYNKQVILNALLECENSGVEAVVFPELTLCGVSCMDGVLNLTLLNACKLAIGEIAEQTKNYNLISFIGFPFLEGGKIYNACAVLNKGEVKAIVVKNGFSKSSESLGYKYFSTFKGVKEIDFLNKKVLFGSDILFKEQNSDTIVLGVEFGEESTLPLSPSCFYSSTATVCMHLNNSVATKSLPEDTANLFKINGLKNWLCYVSAGAGVCESTTDYVYSGYSLIVEGECLKNESDMFSFGLVKADIDTEFLAYKKLKDNIYSGSENYKIVNFTAKKDLSLFETKYDKTPFVPKGNDSLYFSRLADIQAEGIIKRFNHVRAKTIIVGLSGGLDSTLALLSVCRAKDKMGLNNKNVIAITMPCFGTTSRTYLNSIKMAKALGVTLKKIDISKSVLKHLKDINHQKGVYDACYENAQARERTQVLLDIANKENGIVIGTGDLSEVALGWSTYNGDHMSNYAINGSLTKTAVRFMVECYAKCAKPKLKEVLLDILSTPVSPELLPASEDEIVQKTEDIVGPYVLHDYFLYHYIVRGETPKKILFTATKTFEGEFSESVIKGWLKRFFIRFYTQQFKRSCMPDGVRASELSLSPRGAFSLPSDGNLDMFLKELD